MKIVTKNGDMVGIETSNVYYLRRPKPISEAEEYLSVIQRFETLFDTSLIKTEEIEEDEEEWNTINELKEFYEDKYTKTQAYFKILAEKEDWVSTREILKEMEKYGFKGLKSQSISGIRSGNTKSYRKLEKEPLDDREWHGDEWQNHYRIKPKYLELLRNALDIK